MKLLLKEIKMKKREYSNLTKLKCLLLYRIDNILIYAIESLKRFRMFIVLNTRNEIRQNEGKDLLLNLINNLDES